MTPGKNVKRYVAGALNARTGKLLHIFGERKNSDLFILLLRVMLKTYRKSTKIYLVLDNYIIHKSKKVNAFLREIESKIKLHFLPPYSPNDNKIEIIWKHMHDHVTRNHKHTTINSVTDVKFFLDNRLINGKSKISAMKMAE